MALTPDELASMQSDAQLFLPDTGIIMRPTAGTADGMGGRTGGTVSAAGTVACRIRPISPPIEVDSANNLRSVASWVITIPNGTDIRLTDQFTSGGVTYEIVGTPNAGSWEIARRVQAKVVT